MSLRKWARVLLAVIALVTGSLVWGQSYSISTIAGGAPPPSGVPALGAATGNPTAVAADSSGNIYFTSINTLFKIDTKGTLTRIAGNGKGGYSGDNGPAINAMLNGPNAIAIDSKGNIYIADSGNYRIRLISTTGTISTFAGAGFAGAGGDGGPASSASFDRIGGLFVDKAGNLYFSDFGIHVVRKIAAGGTVSTIAGTPGTPGFSGDTGPATSSQLNTPLGVAVDSLGNVYIADSGNQVVRVITLDGNINTFAGSHSAGAGYAGDGGAASAAQLSRPEALAVSSTNAIYIVDHDNEIIRVVTTPDNTISTYAGVQGTSGFSGDGGQAISAAFSSPVGIAFDPSGNLLVADSANMRIRKITPGKVISTIEGGGSPATSGDGGPAISAVFGTPIGIVVDKSGNVYFSDYDNFRIKKIDTSGIITTIAGTGTFGFSGDGGPALSAKLTPAGLALDASGNLYVADYVNNVIRKIDTSGIITTVVGNHSLGPGYAGDGGKATAAQLLYPSAVTFDSAGNMYIADSGNFVIRQVSPAGAISTIAGNNTKGSGGDGGPATSAMLNYVNGLAVSPSGFLYISDWGNNTIRRVYLPSNVIITFAGTGTEGFSGDGTSNTTATLGGPFGIVVDSSDRLFFADSLNSEIRTFNSALALSTVAGNGTVGFSGDGGPATLGTMFYPQGLALDSKGNLYFADAGNQAIRKLTPLKSSGDPVASTNAASNQIGPIAPGEIVTLYGAGIGAQKLTHAANVGSNWPSQVAGTQVLINGVQAPVIYSAADQVAVVVPYELSGASSAMIQVLFNRQSVSVFNADVTASAPAIFTRDSSGAGQAAAINQDTTPNSAQNPARRGSVISLYVTGEGQTSPGGVTGRISAVGKLAHPVLPVSVTIGGVPAVVQYAGSAPGSIAGLMQVNVVIPDGVSTGDVPVIVNVGSSSSPAGVTIAVN